MIYGAFNIAQALDIKGDYIKAASLLSLVGAKKVIDDRGIETYCLTEEQVIKLKAMLGAMREVLK